MSAIQNIKNFIRHGKQAKISNAEPTAHVSNVHAQPAAISDPNVIDLSKSLQPAHALPNEFSTAAVDNRNVAANAADAAAHVAGQNQKNGSNANRKDVDPAVLEQIIAEERAAKGKLPKYPGLDRWTLLEKMGDGAFSNVYRAKDNHGQYDQVAIKVVRKFEMNSGQVREYLSSVILLFVC
jgi:serine/threonine-protein kinase RCK2